ncbi:MAG: hypothetical protein RLZZ70_178 [Candidatus Parcubacteria bacterium]
MKTLFVGTLTAMVMGGMATAETVQTCLAQTTAAPAVSMTGPYQIHNFGTELAFVTGLPSCEAATEHAALMVAAANGGISIIGAVADGTYLVALKPD